jgi:hypothetical protein
MTQTTKIITETEEVTDHRAGQTVFDYRLGKVEETVTKIDGKLDDLAHNFITESTLLAAQREADLQHKILRDEIKNVRDAHGSRLQPIESWMKWAGRIIIGAVLTAVIGLVVITKAGGV